MDPHSTLQQALRHHQTGNLPEAERLYRAVLQQQPLNATALHHLGLLAKEFKHFKPAMDLVAQSVALEPGNLSFRVNQIRLLDSINQRAAAEEAARKLVSERPEDLRLRVDYAGLLVKYRKFELAFAEWDAILATAPQDAALLFQSGLALEHAGAFDKAEERIEAALALQPDLVDAVLRLAMLAMRRGARDLALARLEQANSLSPRNPAILSNLAIALTFVDRYGEALAFAQQAAELAPTDADILTNLGHVALSCGEVELAIAADDRVLAAGHQSFEACSDRLFTRLYVESTPEEELANHRAFQEYCATRIRPSRAAPRVYKSGERLRVGYVSPEFRSHPVGFFIAPLLTHHDRSRFEVHCFSSTIHEDELTQRIRASVDGFHVIQSARTTLEQLDAQIRALGIDILIDLAGHTAGNFLPLFARGPAPLQITYLGYPTTTGLAAMDFRITDHVADPPGNDAFYSERLLRLPLSFGSFEPPAEAPPVREAPHRANGYVTFGSLARVEKWSPATLESWSRILAAVPSAKLRLVGAGFTEPGFVKLIHAKLSAHGIDPSRLQLVGRLPFKEYLAEIGSIDLLLDTNPFNNHTTTLQALYMGVPTVTLAGKLHRSRMGASLMTALGRPELIANSTAEYQRIAIDLAQNPNRLAQMRHTLRDQLLHSSLCDAAQFAHAFESLLIDAWKMKITT